jgi:hypothetical protein
MASNDDDTYSACNGGEYFLLFSRIRRGDMLPSAEAGESR